MEDSRNNVGVEWPEAIFTKTDIHDNRKQPAPAFDCMKWCLAVEGRSRRKILFIVNCLLFLAKESQS